MVLTYCGLHRGMGWWGQVECRFVLHSNYCYVPVTDLESRAVEKRVEVRHIHEVHPRLGQQPLVDHLVEVFLWRAGKPQMLHDKH